VLQITGHPQFGLPFGKDRLVPIYLATLANRNLDQHALSDEFQNVIVLSDELYRETTNRPRMAKRLSCTLIELE
jgi:hypothetical protein